MGNTQGEGRGRRAAHGSSACDHEDESSDGSSEERSDCTSSNEDVRQHDDNEPNSCRSWLASIGLCEPDEPGEEGDGTGSRSLKALLPGKEITAHVLRNADGKTGFRLVECSMKVQEIDRTWGNLATLKNGDVVMAVSGHQVRTHEEYQEQVSGLEEFTITVKRQQALEDCYEVNTEVLGTGGYGSVSKCVDKCSGVTRALKNVPKTAVEENRMQKEIDILLSLDHPNVLKLIQTFEDKRFYYLVTELCSGGELFDRIVAEGHLDEPTSATIMRQVFRAVNYMHESFVSHRDIKPENFLFLNDAPIEDNTLKAIDFGIAQTFGKGKRFTTKTGTPYYVAPEILPKHPQYGPECDLWSCGVLMYVLLSGRLPFKARCENDALRLIARGEVEFPPECFDDVSKDAIRLIRRLLQKDPGARCTALAALSDTWIRQKAPHASTGKGVAFGQGHLEALKGYVAESHFKKAALNVVARQLDEGRIQQLRSLFLHLDKDMCGTLTPQELSAGLETTGLVGHADDLKKLVAAMDADGSGRIDYSEFVAATLQQHHYTQEQTLWAAFRVFDRNGDGRISQRELLEVLSSGDVQSVNAEAVKQIMADVDANGDGYCDFEEFAAMMRK